MKVLGNCEAANFAHLMACLVWGTKMSGRCVDWTGFQLQGDR